MPALSILRLTRSRPAFADASLGARDGGGHAGIVDGALLDQQRDGGVDGVRFVVAAGEALADLGFGQLAPPEHPEGVDVGRPRVHS